MKPLSLTELFARIRAGRALSPAQQARVISHNGGWEDGKADRANRRLAKWYRGARNDYGHFDADYAEGYHAGAFDCGSDNPWRAELLSVVNGQIVRAA